jgi:beta-lactamase superfamily II metal-dependent hydrolase
MLEIDFFPVGDGSRSGDAIAMRLHGPYDARPRVIVVDAGYTDDGEAIVRHVQDVYETDIVDLAIGTHSDSDHINGLKPVLEGLRVQELAIHRPWLYTSEMGQAAAEVRLSKALGMSLEGKFERSLAAVSDVTALADDLGVTIVEPFAGLTRFNGAVTVLGPSREYYCSLLPSFRSAPASLSASGGGVATALRKALESAKETIFDVFESATIETLTNGGSTAAENAASVISLVRYGTEHVLLTGDASIEALEQAADFGMLDYATRPLSLFQAPHHGSKHNLGPDILDRLLGPKGSSGGCGLVSAAAASEKHPSRRVTNAIDRRTNGTWVTRERLLTLSRNSSRGFSPVDAEPFHTWVDRED